MISYFVGILSAALSVAVLGLFGYTGANVSARETFLCWVIFGAAGVLGATVSFSAYQYLELRRLRAMKEFIQDWFAGEKLQPIVDEALAHHARRAKSNSERLIRLQQEGLQTENPNVNATNAEGLMIAFDGVRAHLLCYFRNAQENFYALYDQVRLFADILRVKLKERSWKAYAGEPEIAERVSGAEG